MKPQSFEDYLKEQHFKDYHGDKEHYEDAFDIWLANLDTQEVMDFAQNWGDILTF